MSVLLPRSVVCVCVCERMCSEQKKILLYFLLSSQTPPRWDADEDRDMRDVLDYALASDPHPRDFVVKRVFYTCVVDKLRSRAEWARNRSRISLERSLLRALVESGRIRGKYTRDAHTRKVSGRVVNVFLGIRMATTPPSFHAKAAAKAAKADSDDSDDAEELTFDSLTETGKKKRRGKPRGHRESRDFRNSRLATTISSYIGLTLYQDEKRREDSRKRSAAYRERMRNSVK